MNPTTPLSAHIVQGIDRNSGVALSVIRDPLARPTEQIRSVRRAYAYALHWFAGWSYPEIARFMGRQSHSGTRDWACDAMGDPYATALVRDCILWVKKKRPDLHYSIRTNEEFAQVFGVSV